jgi:hypothetical protein
VGRRAIRLVAMAALVVVATGFAVGLEACGGGSDDAETPAEVLERGGSIARVTVGDDAYDFEVSCHDAGAGSVVAVGTGTSFDPASGQTRASRVLVQAFLGDPYVGVTLSLPPGEDGEAREEVFEAALDESFDLLLEGDTIQADEIAFVRNLDLATGAAEPAGTGSVRVTCNDFEKGMPTDLVR